MVVLPSGNPTAVMFLDESGAVARDRFFAVGCLKLAEPAPLLRAVSHLRDRRHWYKEIHFKDLTRGALDFYKEVVDLLAACGGRFSCFVCDRRKGDPLGRFGGPEAAYEALAVQLLHGNIRRREIVSVLADNYSTRPGITMEENIRQKVNTRLRRLAVTSVVRIDSRAADPLQLTDLLVSAVAFEFRESVKLAASATPKAELAGYVRESYGVSSFLDGYQDDRINVQLYRHNSSESKGGGL